MEQRRRPAVAGSGKNGYVMSNVKMFCDRRPNCRFAVCPIALRHFCRCGGFGGLNNGVGFSFLPAPPQAFALALRHFVFLSSVSVCRGLFQESRLRGRQSVFCIGGHCGLQLVLAVRVTCAHEHYSTCTLLRRLTELIKTKKIRNILLVLLIIFGNAMKVLYRPQGCSASEVQVVNDLFHVPMWRPIREHL